MWRATIKMPRFSLRLKSSAKNPSKLWMGARLGDFYGIWLQSSKVGVERGRANTLQRWLMFDRVYPPDNSLLRPNPSRPFRVNLGSYVYLWRLLKEKVVIGPLSGMLKSRKFPEERGSTTIIVFILKVTDMQCRLWSQKTWLLRKRKKKLGGLSSVVSYPGT